MNDVDRPFNATALGDLLGISQQAVSQHVKAGNIKADGSIADGLKSYLDRVRSIAAGRGGNSQEDLTSARVAESQAKTAILTLQYHEKIGALVEAAIAAKAIQSWTSHTNRELRGLVEKLRVEIESTHKITIPETTLNELVEPVTRRIQNFAAEFAADIAGSGEDI